MRRPIFHPVHRDGPPRREKLGGAAVGEQREMWGGFREKKKRRRETLRFAIVKLAGVLLRSIRGFITSKTGEKKVIRWNTGDRQRGRAADA